MDASQRKESIRQTFNARCARQAGLSGADARPDRR